MSDGNCTYAEFKTLDAAGKCSAATNECNDQVNVFNLFQLYFCSMGEHLYYLIPFGIVYLVLLFDLISSTCENWLTAPLTKIGKTLHFSEALSGVTLIALANGAPDAIAAYSAAGQVSTDGSDTFLAVGSIFGANLFITTIVLFQVIRNGNEIQMQYQTIARDMIFFIIGTLVLIGYGVYGKIGPIQTFAYLGIYVVYCVVVVIQERSLSKETTEPEAVDQENNNQEPLTSGEADPQKSKATSRKGTTRKTVQQIEKEIMKEVVERVFVPEFQGVDEYIQPQRVAKDGVSLQPVHEISHETEGAINPNFLAPPQPNNQRTSSPGDRSSMARKQSLLDKTLE